MIDRNFLSLVGRLRFRLDCQGYIMSQGRLRSDKQFINFFQRQSSSFRIEKVDLSVSLNSISEKYLMRLPIGS